MFCSSTHKKKTERTAVKVVNNCVFSGLVGGIYSQTNFLVLFLSLSLSWV